MTMLTPSRIESYRSQYQSEGFVVIPSLIPSHLLPSLLAASDTITDLARSRRWSQVRVVGKQFPPWTEGDDIWGVQNIMHPDLAELAEPASVISKERVEGSRRGELGGAQGGHEGDRGEGEPGGGNADLGVFGEWYGSEGMLRLSAGFMACEMEDLQFELFNLLINPLHSDFALSWHRDDVKATASPDEEREKLAIDHHGIQWNTALYDDDCLSAVPRSHRRIRTEEERKADLEGGEMPGGVTLQLKAGETVFYNNNILHVGKYQPSTKRRTLHGSYGSPPPGDTTRARNILQHDLSYTRDPAFRASLPASLRPMLDKLNGMKKGLEGVEVGYSQD